MAEVFISYAREDRAKAEHIARGLAAMGLDAFWDTEIPPGQTWADYIESKLSACKAVIVLWSAHSTKSQWVREEARMGREKAKLIPVMLDASAPPFGFGEVQAADLSQWNGDYKHPDWTRLAHAVHVAARGAISAAAAQPQAPFAAQPAFAAQPQSAAAFQTSAAATGGGWRGQSAASAGPQHPPIAYIQKCFRLYADGKGRARRAEYWWWTLFSVGALVLATVIDMQFGTDYSGAPLYPVTTGLVWLALLAPGISVTSRRLHDINLSGWFAAALAGVSIIGGAVSTEFAVGGVISLLAAAGAIVVGVMPPTPGENQFGPNPKDN